MLVSTHSILLVLNNEMIERDHVKLSMSKSLQFSK